MTDIEVVDINDNTNKEDIKENIEEEIKENVKEDIKENVKEEDIKEKKKVRKDLKEKGTCPDCGMEMTQHSLRYTHKNIVKQSKYQQNRLKRLKIKLWIKLKKKKLKRHHHHRQNFKGQYLVLQMLCRWYKSQLMIK